MASIGEMNEAFESIAAVASDGRSLLLAWHERKAGGTIFEAAAGTAASGGAMDMLIRIQRIPGAKLNSRSRSLEAVGRFDTIASEGLAIELLPDGSDYQILGEAVVAVSRNTEQEILRIITKDPLTLREIGEMVREKASDLSLSPPSKQTIRRALDKLVADGLLKRGGKGTRKEPHTYFPEEFDGRVAA